MTTPNASRRTRWVVAAFVAALAWLVALSLAQRRDRHVAAAAGNPPPAEPARPSRTPLPASQSAATPQTTAEDAASQAALNEARGLKPPRRAEVFGRLLQEWIERDPERALAYVRSLPSRDWAYTQGLRQVLAAFARRDPDRALTLAAELAVTPEQQLFYSEFFAVEAERDLTSALKRLAGMTAPRARENALRAIADRWSSRDTDAALAWGRGLPAADAAVVGESVALGLVEANPLRAIEIARSLLVGAALERVLQMALPRLALVDLDSAVALVPMLPPAESQVFAAAEVARALAVRDPLAALAWVRKLPVDSEARRIATTRAISVWAATDPASAGSYAAAMTSGMEQNTATAAVVAAWTPTNPTAAIAWAETLPDASLRMLALAQAADAWARRDPEQAARWVAGQTGGRFADEPTVLNAALSHWVLRDAVAVRSFVSTLAPSVQPRAAEFVAPLLVQRGPAETLAWAQSLAHPAAREGAVVAAFSRWLDNSPGDATRWLAQANLSGDLKARLTRLP